MTPTARLLARPARRACRHRPRAARDSVVLGMVFRARAGPGPDHGLGRRHRGEVVHLSVLEGLTKIGMDGTVQPLLAESWSVDPDGKVLQLQAEARREIPRRQGLRRQRREVPASKAPGPSSTNKAKKSVVRQ